MRTISDAAEFDGLEPVLVDFFATWCGCSSRRSTRRSNPLVVPLGAEGDDESEGRVSVLDTLTRLGTQATERGRKFEPRPPEFDGLVGSSANSPRLCPRLRAAGLAWLVHRSVIYR